MMLMLMLMRCILEAEAHQVLTNAGLMMLRVKTFVPPSPTQQAIVLPSLCVHFTSWLHVLCPHWDGEIQQCW